MRPLALILSLSLLLAAFAPGRWSAVESASCNPALHAAQDALPPCADANRGNDLQRWWIGDMKVRISHHAKLESPVELQMRLLPDPGMSTRESRQPTLLSEHVRQQV